MKLKVNYYYYLLKRNIDWKWRVYLNENDFINTYAKKKDRLEKYTFGMKYVKYMIYR